MSSLPPVPPGHVAVGLRRRSDARALSEVCRSWHTFRPGEGYLEILALDEYLFPPGAHVTTPSIAPSVDAELLTLMLEGTLTYEDSKARAAVISAGEVLHVSVAKGLHFTEFNRSESPARVLRLVLRPRGLGRESRREQRRFSAAQRHGVWCVVGSNDGRAGSLRVDQDVAVFVTRLAVGQHLAHPLAPERNAWLHVIRGSLTLDGEHLEAGDGTSIAGQAAVSVIAQSEAEVMLIELGSPDRSS